MKSFMKRSTTLTLVFVLILGSICSSAPVYAVSGESGGSSNNILSIESVETGIMESVLQPAKVVANAALEPSKVTSISLPTTMMVAVGASQQLVLVQEPANATPEAITYSSSNTAIVEVGAFGRVTGVSLGSATITAKTASGLSANCEVTVVAASKITRIAFTSETESMTVGDSKQLTVKQEPSNVAAEPLTYTSSNEDTATVSATGEVKALSEGTVVITAKTALGLKASCIITVRQPSKITKIYCSPDKLTMTAGDYKELKVVQEPAGEVGEKLTYTSSNTAVVKVTSDGELRAMKQGTAKITVKGTFGLTAVCTVTVKAKIELNKTKASLYYGQKVSLSIKGTTARVTWKTSNKKVVTVTGGKVSAVGVGSAKVYATVGGKTYTCTVTVKKPYINRSSARLENGEKVKLKINTNTKVVWSSSNSKVASISKAGNVTAKKAGKAIITGKIDSKYTVKCSVTVVRQEPDYSMQVASGSMYNCIGYIAKIKNHGNLPLTIYSKGANYTGSVPLHLTKGAKTSKVSSITIPAGKTVTFYFKVSRGSVYYSYYNTTYFTIGYDGKQYKQSFTGSYYY